MGWLGAASGPEHGEEEEEAEADGGDGCEERHVSLLTRQHGCLAIGDGTLLSP